MDNLSVYRELADSYDRLGQASMRDRFLILAADAALEAGQDAEAECLRQRLLQGSRHHMLRPYSSFAEAVRAADVQTYLRDLKVNYPPEVAQQLLESLQNAPGTGPTGDPKPARDWGKPAPPESAPAIPPTAPLLDLASPSPPQPGDLVGGFPRREDRGASAPLRPGRFDAIPIREEQAPPVTRPLAQPLPGRVPLPRSASAARPSSGVPVAKPATLPPTTAMPPVARRIESPTAGRVAPAPAGPPGTRNSASRRHLAEHAPGGGCSDGGIGAGSASPWADHSFRPTGCRRLDVLVGARA